jgi:hypothetical protein
MSDEKKDLQIIMHPGVEADMAGDPAMAEAVRDFTARMRQAYAAVQSGQHQTIDDAMRALGIHAVKIDPETGEEIEGASFQADLDKGSDDEC